MHGLTDYFSACIYFPEVGLFTLALDPCCSQIFHRCMCIYCLNDGQVVTALERCLLSSFVGSSENIFEQL